MKILFLFFLLCKLSNNYFKYSYFFLQKIWSIIIGFFYLLEYIFLFYFQKNNMYIIFIYKYLVIKKYKIYKQSGFYWKKNNYVKKISKKKEENKYVKMFNKYYRYRRMYWGLTVVYIQIFLRKIRESKNYIIFLINKKIIWNYKLFKWRIRVYSFFYFFLYNYRLVLFYKRLKKRLRKFIMFVWPILMYIKIKIKIISSTNRVGFLTICKKIKKKKNV